MHVTWDCGMVMLWVFLSLSNVLSNVIIKYCIISYGVKWIPLDSNVIAMSYPMNYTDRSI